MAQLLPYPVSPPSSKELVLGPGEPMETERHLQQMLLLLDSLQYAWRDRSDVFVGGNLFLYFSETQCKRNDFRGPDLMVVLNTIRRERRAWFVWEEGGQTPNVIIELLSDSTEHVDRGEKMRVYARLKVGEYFLFDPFSGVLEGYDLDIHRGAYVQKPLDRLGRVRCEQMDLLLGKVPGSYHGIDAHWLRWLLPDGTALALPVEKADAETERANAATERANAADERVRQLMEELAATKARG